jgi:hypothetical protein
VYLGLAEFHGLGFLLIRRINNLRFFNSVNGSTPPGLFWIHLKAVMMEGYSQ